MHTSYKFGIHYLFPTKFCYSVTSTFIQLRYTINACSATVIHNSKLCRYSLIKICALKFREVQSVHYFFSFKFGNSAYRSFYFRCLISYKRLDPIIGIKRSIKLLFFRRSRHPMLTM